MVLLTHSTIMFCNTNAYRYISIGRQANVKADEWESVITGRIR